MRRKKTFNWRWLAASAAGFSGAGAAHALDASDVLVFSKGPVSLRPQFELVEQFTDNVYYNTGSKVADLITIISPGLRLVAGQDLPTENHFTLRYTLDDLIYLNESSQDAIQHRAGTETRFKWSRFAIEGNDRIEFLSSALGGGLTLAARTPVDRFIVGDIYRFDYRLGERTGVHVEAHHNSVDYQNGLRLFDTRRIEGIAGFDYYLTADTRLFGEGYYGETSLHDNSPTPVIPPGTSFVGGFVGARGKFTEKLNGTVKAGYEVSSFSGGAIAGNNSAGEAPVVEADLTYNFSDRSRVNLGYNRRQFVSVQFVRSAYTADQVSLGVSQIIGSAGRLRLDGSILYQALEFDPSPGNFASRSDSNWQLNAGASWYFETWLSTNLRYTFERYSSDLPSVVDYNVNRITLSLAVGY